MSTGYEDGKAALDDLIDWYGENESLVDRNEATTRLHLIDRLLREVLGWPAEEVVCEHRIENQYADYALGKPATRLIVEAKREGVYFSLPVGETSLISQGGIVN